MAEFVQADNGLAIRLDDGSLGNIPLGLKTAKPKIEKLRLILKFKRHRSALAAGGSASQFVLFKLCGFFQKCSNKPCRVEPRTAML